jgi:hypothetical protein
MAGLPLTAFDVAVLIVIALSVLISLMRGVTREALSLACWLGASAVAWYGFGYARELARQTIETDWLADAAALANLREPKWRRLPADRIGALACACGESLTTLGYA